MTKRRIIVLGLDAMSPKLMLDWVRDGTLPCIGSLLECGLSGSIEGLDGYFIGSTWPSFYTGVSPAKHGFHYQHQLVPGTYQLHDVADGEPTRCPPFWCRLGDAGLRVALLDIPLSRLDPAVNGIQVVEWGVHDDLYGPGTQPPELQSEIASKFGPHLVGAKCDGASRTATDYCEFTDRLVQSIATKTNLTRHLLARESWDLFVQVFSESHCVGHQCWHLHEVEHPGYDPTLAATSGDPVRRVYKALDNAISEILADVSDATVIVMSAHGMTHWYGAQFLLRDVLIRLGAAMPLPTPVSTRGARDVLLELAGAGWRRLPVSLRHRLAPLRSRLGRVSNAGPRLATAGLEPSLSLCFPLSNGMGTSGIRLNVTGREPQGRLQAGVELEAFVASLTADLLALEEATTGARLVHRVVRTADTYTGPCLDVLPDLVVEWSRDHAVGSSLVNEDRGGELAVRHPRFGTVTGVNRYGRTGEHTPDGWFIVTGPNVPTGVEREVGILDFAPTICWLLGVQHEGFDGKPIKRICEPESPT